jgi:SSS family solute:Na+ symporter
MGWSFFFTVLVMGVLSLAGPKVNPNAFALDKEMFRLKPSSIFLIILILLILMGLYLRFW